ncbi:MAG: 7-cyano-7-deazaguanine synthase QueC [Elusimicrobia bacterium]|nr:7-cyano-7-deazaguanine synthase QueC [Elusimicrobiota bacterium]
MKQRRTRGNMKAVVLFSGGLDSTTVLYDALARGYRCHCVIFDYGQRHKKEILCAVRIAKKRACPYQIIRIVLPWNLSSLIGTKNPVPTKNSLLKTDELPSTYVPGRNTLFISFALSYAETIGAGTIFIGANAVDYSGYPDCRPQYYTALNRVLTALGTGVTIKTPLIHLSKAQIIRRGNRLGVPYDLTWSCYQGGEKPCGVCDSCRFRDKGFEEA